MASLLDIAGNNVSDEIDFRGGKLSVRGLSIGDIMFLVKNFEVIRKVFSGKEIDFNSVFDLGEDVVAAVIAGATDDIKSEKARQVAASLTVSEQMEILERVIDLTVKQSGGVQNFLEKIMSLVKVLDK